MLASLDARTKLAAQTQATRSTWLRTAMIKEWATTHHVSLREATTMVDGLAKQGQSGKEKLGRLAAETRKSVVEHFNKMGSEGRQKMRDHWVKGTTEAQTGGTNIGEGLRKKLAEKAASISRTTEEYAANLAKALNPILAGINAKLIDARGYSAAKTYSSGGGGGGRTVVTRNTGGMIPGGGPDRDSVPAMLTPPRVRGPSADRRRGGRQQLACVE